MNSRKRRHCILGLLLIFILGGELYFLRTFSSEERIDRIVLITIDTLRADHLGAYGYIQDTSPFIDLISKNAVLFENHVASMATTMPSHASLFTSKYPLQHRVMKNGHKMGDGLCTMAEAFRSMGYDTAGVVSTIGHFKAGNLDQGFEYFNEPNEKLIYGGKKYRDAHDTMKVAMNWLSEKKKNDKFLLWVHLFDPHTPYVPPPKFYLELLESKDQSRIYNYWTKEQKARGDFFADKSRLIKEITAYDAEVRYVDQELSRLFLHYQQEGFDRNSLWIITADHGEGLGNHNWWEHGKNVYNEQLRIPLLWYFSSGMGKGKKIKAVVENIDVLPTLLELVEGDARDRKKEELEGQSLMSFISDDYEDTFSKRYAFSQRRAFDGPVPKTINPKKTNYEAGDTYTLQSTKHKYIHRTKGNEEFYNLANDPHEVNNLAGRGISEEKRMREVLLKKIENMKKNTEEEHIKVKQHAIEQLESLGYVQ